MVLFYSQLFMFNARTIFLHSVNDTECHLKDQEGFSEDHDGAVTFKYWGGSVQHGKVVQRTTKEEKSLCCY